MTKPTIDDVMALVQVYGDARVGTTAAMTSAQYGQAVAVRNACEKNVRAALEALAAPVAAAPARREDMEAFAAELRADPEKAKRFFTQAGIIGVGGKLTPAYGGQAQGEPGGELRIEPCHYSMLPDHICNKCGRIHGYSHPPRADAKIVPIGPREPDMTMVICPACTSQFRAIPVEVQEEVARLRAALEKIEHEANQPYIQRIAAAALKGE